MSELQDLRDVLDKTPIGSVVSVAIQELDGGYVVLSPNQCEPWTVMRNVIGALLDVVTVAERHRTVSDDMMTALNHVNTAIREALKK